MRWQQRRRYRRGRSGRSASWPAHSSRTVRRAATAVRRCVIALLAMVSALEFPIRKSTVAVDPYSAEVTARQGWEDFPMPAKLTTLGVQAHSGTLFGLANQLALAALAVGALVLLVLGYRMWWQRRPVGRRSAAAPAPVFRRVSRPLTAVIVVVCGGLAWAMPVFGFTLAGFLVADFGIRALGRRKARTA